MNSSLVELGMVTSSLNDLVSGFPRMPVTVKPSMGPLYVCLGLKFGSRSMAAEQATPKKIILCYREGLKQAWAQKAAPGQSPPEPRDRQRQSAKELG